MARCKMEGCEKNIFARELCRKHYNRARAKGEFPWQRRCSVDGCKGFAEARGVCKQHYDKLRHEGKISVQKICSVDGCTKGIHTEGLCRVHYWRKISYGSTAEPKPRTAMERWVSYVMQCEFDPVTLCWLYPVGGMCEYPMLRYMNRNMNIIRFYFIHILNENMDGLVVRHGCKNRNCINPDHLKKGTYSENRLDSLYHGHWEAVG